VPLAPITLFLVGIPFLWRRSTAGERGPLAAASLLAGLGFIVLVGVSWALFGTTQRYAVDFTSLLLIPAFFVWAMLVSRAPPGTMARRLWAVGGVTVTLMGAGVGTALSFTGYQDLLRLMHPSTFSTLEDLTGPFATVATMFGGRPQIARIENGATAVTPAPEMSGFSEDHADTVLTVAPPTLVVLSPGTRHTAVTVTVGGAPESPPPSLLQIKVTSEGRSRIVPLNSKRVRLPVTLHWGLNRIQLALIGRPIPVNPAPPPEHRPRPRHPAATGRHTPTTPNARSGRSERPRHPAASGRHTPTTPNARSGSSERPRHPAATGRHTATAPNARRGNRHRPSPPMWIPPLVPNAKVLLINIHMES